MNPLFQFIKPALPYKTPVIIALIFSVTMGVFVKGCTYGEHKSDDKYAKRILAAETKVHSLERVSDSLALYRRLYTATKEQAIIATTEKNDAMILAKHAAINRTKLSDEFYELHNAATEDDK